MNNSDLSESNWDSLDCMMEKLENNLVTSGNSLATLENSPVTWQDRMDSLESTSEK